MSIFTLTVIAILLLSFVTVGLCCLIILYYRCKIANKNSQHLPQMRGVFPLGHLNFLQLRNGLPFMTSLSYIIFGMAKIFQNEGIFLVKLGLSSVVALSCADKVKVLLSNKDELKKSTLYKFSTKLLGLGLLTNEGDEKYKMRRKAIIHMFHVKNLERYQKIMARQSNILENELMSLTEKESSSILLGKHLKLCAFQIIIDAIMGVKLGSDDISSQCDLFHSIQFLQEAWGHSLIHIWMQYDTIFNNSPIGIETNKQIFKLKTFIGNLLRERKTILKEEMTQIEAGEYFESPDETNTTLVDLLIREQRRNPEVFSDNDIYHEITSMIVAGFDTSAVSLSWTIHLISTHPKVQGKIHQEIDTALGKINDENVPEVSNYDISQLKYLQCVLKESLRLHNPLSIFARVLREDLSLGDFKVLKNSEVAVDVWSLHRNPKYFEKPDEFMPERFLPENSKDRHPYCYVPFSAGPRSCIGKAFAEKSLVTILATLFRRFEIKCTEPNEYIHIDWSVTAKPHKELRYNLTRRF